MILDVGPAAVEALAYVLKTLPHAGVERAPARKSLRIFRYMLSVSMNYFISGSTSH